MRIFDDNINRLSSIEDKSFQMILTDPPYDLSEELKLWYHAEFIRLCRGTIIVFMPPENQWVLPADQYLFWEKPISTKNTSRKYSRFMEMIFLYSLESPKWNTGRHWSQYTNIFKDLVDDVSLHPYRKPPSLIERLLLNHTDVGDLILDPFAGSFVVDDVARRLRRETVSIEISNL